MRCVNIVKWCYLIGLLCCAAVLKAEMIDTFQFHSDADRIRAMALARSLRCPQCQNQNLVESNATIAYRLRLEVYQMVNEGKSDEQIIQIMTDRFGQFVNYKPPINQQTLLLWGLPFGLLLGLLGMVVMKTLRKKKDH